MRRVVNVAFVLSIIAASRPSVARTQQPDFLSLARNAVGGPEALAQIHSLHVTLTSQHVSNGGGDDPRGELFGTLQVWLAPPYRFAEVFSSGGGLTSRNAIDDGRVLSHHGSAEQMAARIERAKLRRFALTLLLFDADALRVTLTDEGAPSVNGKVVRALQASDEAGFDLRLYFDPASHRLLMSDDFTLTSHGSVDVKRGQTGFPSGTSPKATPERLTYGDYRRVDGIDLPFSITREIKGTVDDLYHVIKYDVNPPAFDKEFKR